MCGFLVSVRSRTVLAVAVVFGLSGVALPANPAQATFAGSNGRISFTREAHNCWDLLSVKPSGAGATAYTNCASGAGVTAWSPSGLILAAGLRLGNDANIRLATIDAATGAHRYVAGVAASDDPSWSPDASALVYVSDVTSFGAYQNVYTVPAGGGQPVNLTRFASGSGHLVADPEFSPDGRTIVFEQTPPPAGSAAQIWAMGADGAAPTQLATSLPGSSISPSWSPDGKHIAFANNSTGSYDIYTMAADGSAVSRISGAAGAQETEPVWSPDGTEIAYTVGCKDAGCYDVQHDQMENGDIYVMNADGSNRHALVATANPEFGPDWGSSTVSCSSCGSGGSGGGGSGSTGHQRVVTFRIATLKIVGTVAVPDGTNSCRASVPVTVQRVQSLEYPPQDKDWRRGTIKTVRTTHLGHFQVPITLGGEYRVVAAATTTSGGPCAKAVSNVHENDLIHDPRGDSHGPIDIKWASLRYAHHKVIGQIVTYSSFSSNNNPCFLVNGDGPNRPGAAVGCFRQVLCCTNGNGAGPPVQVSRPDSRTIVFTSTISAWKRMGFSKKQRWLNWVAWARLTDSQLWDDAPDGCFQTSRDHPPCPGRMPVLTLPASAF